MATKRKAQEAFGRPKEKEATEKKLFSGNGLSNGQLSAFAAARQSTQPTIAAATKSEHEDEEDEEDIVPTIARAPYDGQHSGLTTPGDLTDADDQLPSTITTKPAVQLSTFAPKKGDILRDDNDALEFRLRADESATFVGEYNLEVLKGVVTVYGAMLHPDLGVQRVHAPSTSALPAIVAKKDGSVVRLTSIASGIEKLESLSPLFRNIGAKDEIQNRSFTLLSSSSDDALRRSLGPLEIDDETKRVISRLNAGLEVNEKAVRVMAVGPKSSGKSTFNRLLCNMITSRNVRQKCLYLDLDPGQPEFGPPGQVSLIEINASILGPSFTHPANPNSKAYRLLRSHTIAAMSFKDDPEHYLACASDLIRQAPKGLPLVVNNCGWVSGLGASMLMSLTDCLSVNEIVILDPIDVPLAEALSGSIPNQIHRIPRRQRQPSSRTPAELRAMQTMAYFHHRPSTANPRWSSKSLSRLRPWIVTYDGRKAGIAASVSYGQAPHPDFLGEVLDGSVVAIVIPDDEAIELDSIHRTDVEALPFISATSDGSTPPLDPRKSQCIGLALIRGIDVESKSLHLLTPLTESKIAELVERQVVLVRGGFDAPEWAYLEDLHGGEVDEEERPWVSRKAQVGIEGSVWRLRHPPMAKDVR